jgi:D-proline reductase (dithiol) PrdB
MELPFSAFGTELSAARVALVTTGGVHLPEDEPFDIDDPAGDCSYREIPTSAERLTWTHFYHRPDGAQDLETVLPLRTMRRLVDEGFVGQSNHRHFSFMGAIHDPGPLVEGTAPEVARKLLDDGVDAVLLTPS